MFCYETKLMVIYQPVDVKDTEEKNPKILHYTLTILIIP